jgi:hypothetical protein
LPVVDQVAAEYEGKVDFVAVAGRSDLGSSVQAAETLFSDNLMWGLDESIWDLYGARGQPVTVTITADGRIADSWYGVRGAAALREAIDGLLQ